MITCNKMPDGTFTIAGLNEEQLVTIEDGVITEFNACVQKIPIFYRQYIKHYRRYLLEIKMPISDALDFEEKRKLIENENLKLNF